LFFSIIIPTFNRNDLLGKCLSLLEQQVGLTDHEIIVTDDSKDNIAQKLIETKYPWIKWVEGPKKGPASNRNNGAKFAKGGWLIFLDDDCEPSNTFVFEYSNYIKQNPAVFVFEGCIKSDGPALTPLDYAPINMNGGYLWSCNFCIDNTVFKNLNGFDENFKYPHLEDVDLKLRVLQHNYTIYFCEKAYVVHPWRRFSDGKKLALFNEMDFYFAKKHNKNISILKTSISIVSVHFNMFLNNPKFLFLYSAIKIATEHAFFFILYSNKWKKKYFN